MTDLGKRLRLDMQATVEIKLSLTDKSAANAVYQSIIADNVSIPKGLDITMKLEKDSIILIASTGSKVDTLISTVDDVLKSCQLSLDSIMLMDD